MVASARVLTIPEVHNLPLFRGVSPAEVQRVRSLARRERVAVGAWLFEQGQPASALFLLDSGRVRVTQSGPGGQQVVLHLVSPGEAFGCSAILHERQYPGSAEVVAEAVVERFDAAALRVLEREVPQVAANALGLLAARVRDLRVRYREAVTQRVEPRIASTLVRLVQQTGVVEAGGGTRIGLRLSRQDLAELAGTTMFTVSRTLTSWEQLGLVEVARQRVTVCDVERLTALAEAG